MEHGEVYAVTSGTIMMLVLFVDNWDILLMVTFILHCCSLHTAYYICNRTTCILASNKPFLYTGAIGPSLVYFTSSTPSHNIIDLNCTGDENTILECSYNGLTNYNCPLSDDANVFCECKEFYNYTVLV